MIRIINDDSDDIIDRLLSLNLRPVHTTATSVHCSSTAI